MDRKSKLIYADNLISALRDDPAINGANLRRVIQHINDANAVEEVHGRWINNGGRRKMDLYCSVCNRRASNFVGGYEDWWDLWFPKYCPNCGAKMDGGNEDG